MSDKWIPNVIRQKLEKDNKWLERGILAIYKYQTIDERVQEQTKHFNDVGFNGVDGKILSSFAKFIQRSSYPEGRRLTDRQLAVARKKMPKYAGQLAKIANGVQ